MHWLQLYNSQKCKRVVAHVFMCAGDKTRIPDTGGASTKGDDDDDKIACLGRIKQVVHSFTAVAQRMRARSLTLPAPQTNPTCITFMRRRDDESAV